MLYRFDRREIELISDALIHAVDRAKIDEAYSTDSEAAGAAVRAQNAHLALIRKVQPLLQQSEIAGLQMDQEENRRVRKAVAYEIAGLKRVLDRRLLQPAEEADLIQDIRAGDAVLQRRATLRRSTGGCT